MDHIRRQMILGGGAFALATASSSYGLPSTANCPISPVKRILVIEENALIAAAEEIVLTEAGYEVICPLGFNQLKTSIFNSKIDAALLDAHIYGEPTTHLAVTLTVASIPFAFTSGYGPDLSKCLPIQFWEIAILPKPFRKTQLLTLVQGLI